MKKLLLLACLVIAGFSMNAQRIDLGVNVMLGFPMGDYSFGSEMLTMNSAPGMGIGGGIDFNYWLNDNIAVGLEAGYLSFSEGEETNAGITSKRSFTGIPVMVKGTYYFGEEGFRPYAGLGLGYMATTQKSVTTIDGFPELESESEWDQNGLLISPRAGFLYYFSDAIALNFNLQYNLVMNEVDGDLDVTSDDETVTVPNSKVDATNFLGINIGVIFSLSE